ncbi:unnamed protein product [Oncorhynchus mykiss]|uniref:Uncharacterized protein n=1 Tax=Oncorhynchus mykiss TaxID=8022 RepID=A0A060Z1E8_ONCMY|nr:unnamed protein product [Oncorhynchus mykiss]
MSSSGCNRGFKSTQTRYYISTILNSVSLLQCEDPSGYKQEDEFMDILEERRRSSDLGHALRTFTPSPYRGAPPLSAGALNRTVLESQYLRYVTKEVAMETGESVDLVREEASGILDEMSQNLQLGFIRLLGFTLSKVFKRLFSHININQEGLNRVRILLL